MSAALPPIIILIDADACPVKDEIYRVAERFKPPRPEVHVRVVSNAPFRIPDSPRIRRVVVDGYSEYISGGGQPPASAESKPKAQTCKAHLQGRPSLCEEPSGPNGPRPAPEGPKYDAADDWIAEAADALPQNTCVVITADILLADRCLKAGARVLKHNGEEFSPTSIGGAIATRAIMADLRAGMDGIGGGLAPFSKADRSRFLQSLDRVLVGLARG
jgi:hypothetical protein